ncbi:MAG TPA: nitrophenyl compound nitroreductase subunit ArsF family protein [Prolixibacteraceae bacterium]|nr:nitrophenyl compound nitroreductase subunit ArsF family protein [Prolixibacteraceae bacterium]
MKKLIALFSVIALFATTSVYAQKAEKEAIEAYYFHYTSRCVTCQSVEKVSSDALKELSGGKIVLKSINLDDKSNKELAKKLKIDGQTLLVVKGVKKVDITNDGFLYATTSPEKLKAKLKTAVESLK